MPEQRRVWSPEVVWLPANLTRTYGPFRTSIQNALELQFRNKRNPLILHPQAPAAHGRLRDQFGSEELTGIRVTPTSSYRSVLAFIPQRDPVVLKLSLGVKVAGIRRSLSERKLASSVMMSTILDTIPAVKRERFHFDWFPEPAGLVETISGCGWLLRQFPRFQNLVPVFSLIAQRGAQPPLLIECIARSGTSPVTFVLEQIIRPYVRLLAYLMFEEGLHVEGHAQNILLETDEEESLSGRIILRDLADITVNIPMRLARKKPFPTFGKEFVSSKPRFPLASVTSDHVWNRKRDRIMRARDTVERYGLGAFLGTINPVVARHFPNYDAIVVENEYLNIWQQETIHYLNVKPLFRDHPKGLPTDEAIAHVLKHTDWKTLGSVRGETLLKTAEPLLIDHRESRLRGKVYERVQCEWGSLFLHSGLPAFFAPAF